MPSRPQLIAAALVGGLALSTLGVMAQPDERATALIDAVQAARGQGSSSLKGGSAGGGSSGGSGGGGSDPEAQARAFFEAEVHPLVFPRCYSACHEPAGVAGVSRLVMVGDSEADQVNKNYDVFKTFITSAGTAEILLARISGSSHPGGTVYDTSSSQYATIEEFTRFF